MSKNNQFRILGKVVVQFARQKGGTPLLYIASVPHSSTTRLTTAVPDPPFSRVIPAMCPTHSCATLHGRPGEKVPAQPFGLPSGYDSEKYPGSEIGPAAKVPRPLKLDMD